MLKKTSEFEYIAADAYGRISPQQLQAKRNGRSHSDRRGRRGLERSATTVTDSPAAVPVSPPSAFVVRAEDVDRCVAPARSKPKRRQTVNRGTENAGFHIDGDSGGGASDWIYRWSDETCDVEAVARMFSAGDRQMPVVAKVTDTGVILEKLCGVISGQVYLIQSCGIQSRVIAEMTDAQYNNDPTQNVYVSLPADCQMNIAVKNSSSGSVAQEVWPFREAVELKSLPLLARVLDVSEAQSVEDSRDHQQLTIDLSNKDLRIISQHQSTFLRANVINNGWLEQTSMIAIPSGVGIRFSLAVGLTGLTDQEWYDYQNMFARSVRHQAGFQPTTGYQGILKLTSDQLSSIADDMHTNSLRHATDANQRNNYENVAIISTDYVAVVSDQTSNSSSETFVPDAVGRRRDSRRSDESVAVSDDDKGGRPAEDIATNDVLYQQLETTPVRQYDSLNTASESLVVINPDNFDTLRPPNMAVYEEIELTTPELLQTINGKTVDDPLGQADQPSSCVTASVGSPACASIVADERYQDSQTSSSSPSVVHSQSFSSDEGYHSKRNTTVDCEPENVRSVSKEGIEQTLEESSRGGGGGGGRVLAAAAIFGGIREPQKNTSSDSPRPGQAGRSDRKTAVPETKPKPPPTAVKPYQPVVRVTAPSVDVLRANDDNGSHLCRPTAPASTSVMPRPPSVRPKPPSKKGAPGVGETTSTSSGSALTKLSEVPNDMSGLSAVDVSKCIVLLGLGSNMAEKTAADGLDGQRLQSMSVSQLTEQFLMTQFDAAKLVRFARGWRPVE